MGSAKNYAIELLGIPKAQNEKDSCYLLLLSRETSQSFSFGPSGSRIGLLLGDVVHLKKSHMVK